MQTLEDCVAKAPITIVYIGTESQLVERFLDSSQTSQLDDITVLFASNDREALTEAVKAQSSGKDGKVVIHGLIKYMNDNYWSRAQKVAILGAVMTARIELADDCVDMFVTKLYSSSPSS